jgi:DivIVA domain-containing protein
MLLAVLACALGLATVLFALYRDEPLAAPVPATPDWDVLPTPSDVGHGEFRLSFAGYDPATVEVYLDRLRRAYGDLYAEATPETLERARERAALRAGVEPVRQEQPARRVVLDDEQDDAGDAWSQPPGGNDALRLEAALSSVDPDPSQAAAPGDDRDPGDRSGDRS